MSSISPTAIESTPSITDENHQPPQPYSSTPYEDSSAHPTPGLIYPSLVCAAVLPVCFLIFGLVILALVHRQQRYLREILAIKHTKSAVAFHSGERRAKGSAICVRTNATCGGLSSSSESAPDYVHNSLLSLDVSYELAHHPGGYHAYLRSFSTQVLIGSTIASPPASDESRSRDEVPHYNTPNTSRTSSSVYSDRFTSSSGDSITSATRFVHTCGRRNLPPSRRTSTPSPNVVVESGAIVQYHATGGASVQAGENSENYLPSATVAPPPDSVSESMAWDNFLPDDAHSEHFGFPVELSETEHWV